MATGPRETIRQGMGRRLMALATAAVLLAGCTTQRAADIPTGAARPLPTGPVKVALLVPIGDERERVSRDARAIARAARLALTGSRASAVDLVVLDTRGTREGAREAATQAIEEGAAILLGPLFATSTAAVAPVAAAAEVPVLSFSTDTDVAGPPVWVTGFTPEEEVGRILAFAGRRGLDTVGVYAPDTPYGRKALGAVDEAATGARIGVVARTVYPRSVSDIERTAPGFATEAVRTGAEAVLVPDFGPGLSTAASFLAGNGLLAPRVRFLGTGQWQAPSTLHESALRGGWFAGADPDATRAFGQRYAARFGERPPFVAVLGHDAALIAAELAEAAPAGTFPYGRAALTREIGFAGAVGALRLRRDGTVQRGLAVMEVGTNGFAVLEPAPSRLDAGL